jgi:hypothetical protein
LSNSPVVFIRTLTEEQISHIVNNKSKNEIANILWNTEQDKKFMFEKIQVLQLEAKKTVEKYEHIDANLERYKNIISDIERRYKRVVRELRAENKRLRSNQSPIYDGPKGKLDRDIERNVFSFEEIFK